MEYGTEKTQIDDAIKDVKKTLHIIFLKGELLTLLLCFLQLYYN